MTTNELEESLLARRDLPSGWSVADVEDHPTEVPGAEDIDSVLASAFFQKSDFGPFLGHMLLAAERGRDARTAFSAIEEELEEADILDGISDEVREWETRPLDFTDLGDETFAFRAVGDTGSIPVVADMVTIRHGRFVSLIIYAEVLGVDSDQTEEYVRMAIDKLPE